MSELLAVLAAIQSSVTVRDYSRAIAWCDRAREIVESMKLADSGRKGC